MNFNELIEFIKNYWLLLVVFMVFLIILLIISLITKKKPVINLMDSILKDVLELLPMLINKVEVPGNGSTKKNLVLVAVHEYLVKKYGYLDFSQLEKQVSNYIEDILSTPKKTKED